MLDMTQPGTSHLTAEYASHSLRGAKLVAVYDRQGCLGWLPGAQHMNKR
jgi:hypothetical protein